MSRVIDGDTLVLDMGEKIRLAGINSPELAKKNLPAEPLANEAKSALKGYWLMGGHRLKLRKKRKIDTAEHSPTCLR